MAQIPRGTRRKAPDGTWQRFDGRYWRSIGSASSSSRSSGSGSETAMVAGNIVTQPDKVLFFNAPFDDKRTYFMKIINASESEERIAFRWLSTNNVRLGVDPKNGVLDPKESIVIAVSCDAFKPEMEETKNDRLDIDWTKPPEGASKQFNVDWFKKGEGIVRRKNLFVRYNL